MIELIKQVQAWAKEKGIYDKSTADKQWLGMVAEIGEVADCLMKEQFEEAEMELGDVIVYYINFMTMSNEKIKISNFAQMSFGNQDEATIIDLLIYEASSLHDCIAEPPEFENAVAIAAGYIGTTPERALRRAYEKISKRSGEMKNGKFRKDVVS